VKLLRPLGPPQSDYCVIPLLRISPMKLKPIIASYSGGFKIQQYLNESVLEVVAAIAQSPRPSAEIAKDVLTELVEMHALVEHEGLVKLNTAVFLKGDIENILNTIKPFANEFAQQIVECGGALQNAPAEITIFFGGSSDWYKAWA
jgi:hypothetical protein